MNPGSQVLDARPPGPPLYRCVFPACLRIRSRVLLLFCGCGGRVMARAGYALLLMSVAVAVLGSVVFVQDTWFS